MTVERVDVVVGAGGENAQRVSHDQDIKVRFDINKYYNSIVVSSLYARSYATLHINSSWLNTQIFAHLKYNSLLTVSQEPQCARLSRALTCSPIF